MDRRGFLASIPAAASVAIGAGALAAAVPAHSAARDEIVRYIFQVEGSEALEQATATLIDAAALAQSTKDAQYDELAGMILALEEIKAEHSDTHIHSLFRFEVNGYCAAMRRAYPEDQLVKFNLAWAKDRANGRVPMSPDSTEYGMWAPHYVLVEPSERSAEVERRRAAIPAGWRTA